MLSFSNETSSHEKERRRQGREEGCLLPIADGGSLGSSGPRGRPLLPTVLRVPGRVSGPVPMMLVTRTAELSGSKLGCVFFLIFIA